MEGIFLAFVLVVVVLNLAGGYAESMSNNKSLTNNQTKVIQ